MLVFAASAVAWDEYCLDWNCFLQFKKMTLQMSHIILLIAKWSWKYMIWNCSYFSCYEEQQHVNQHGVDNLVAAPYMVKSENIGPNIVHLGLAVVLLDGALLQYKADLAVSYSFCRIWPLKWDLNHGSHRMFIEFHKWCDQKPISSESIWGGRKLWIPWFWIYM